MRTTARAAATAGIAGAADASNTADAAGTVGAIDIDYERMTRAFAGLHASETTLDDVCRKLAERGLLAEKPTPAEKPAPAGGSAPASGRLAPTGQSACASADRLARRRHPAGRHLSRRRTGTVLLAAALVACCGTAYATGAFERIMASLTPADGTPASLVEAFSGDAVSTEKPVMISATGAPIDLPDMARVALDATQADGILGGYASTLGTVVSAGNWTFELGDFVADKNGFAVLTFTMSNPAGVDDWYVAGYGEIALHPSSDLRGPSFEVVRADGTRVRANYRFAQVERDETSIRAVAYIDTLPSGALEDGASGDGASGGTLWEDGAVLEMTVSAVDPARAAEGASVADEDVLVGAVVDIAPERYAPCTALTCDDGTAVVVSALGLRYTKDASQGEFVPHEVAVRFAGGDEYDEYVVKSEKDGLFNYLFGTVVSGTGVLEGSDVYSMVFNRLVDVAAVEEVRIEGPDRGDGAA